MHLTCSRTVLRCLVIISRKHSSLFSGYYDTVIIQSTKKLQRKLCSKCYSTNFLSEKTECTDLETELEPIKKLSYEIRDYNAITDGDPEKLKLAKVIQFELDIMAQEEGTVPLCISEKQWRELILMSSSLQRRKYLRHLWLKDMVKMHKKKIKDKNKTRFVHAEEETRKTLSVEITTAGPILYKLRHNTLFFRISTPTISEFYNYKLHQATMFNNKIIIDMSYERFMSLEQLSLCAQKLHLLFKQNRYNFNPSHLIFCNADKRNSVLMSKLNVRFPNLFDEDFPFAFTEKCYLDLYPKEQVVYLTPHCKEELIGFDPNSIYVIGAISETFKSTPLSLAKAKEQGLRVAKFPLDKYIKWRIGIKSLHINQCLCILNDVKNGADWRFALRQIAKKQLPTNITDQD